MLISQQLLNRIKVNDPKLTSLDLSRYQLTDTDIIELGCAFDNNTTIKHLTLNSDRKLSINSKKILMSIKTITHLSLNCSNIDDEDIQALKTNDTLLALDLSNNRISDIGAAMLAKHPKLKTLNLSGNKITDIGAQKLASNKTLVHLGLLFNKLNNPGVRTFANTNTLTSLKISISSDPNEYRATVMDLDIYELFANNQTLTHLYLDGDVREGGGNEAMKRNQELFKLQAKIQRRMHENYNNQNLARLIECYTFSSILNTRNRIGTDIVTQIFSFLINIDWRKKPSFNEDRLYKIASSPMLRAERLRMWQEDKHPRNLITNEITTNCLHHHSQATNDEQRPIEAAPCCIIS